MDRDVNVPTSAPLFFGVFLLGLGVALLLDRLGYWELGGFGQLWPLFLIVPGVRGLLAKGADVWSLGVITLGGIFLLQNYSRLRFSDSWPALIVVIGLTLVWEAIAGRHPSGTPPSTLLRDRLRNRLRGREGLNGH